MFNKVNVEHKKDFANKASMLQNASSFHACVLSIKGGRNERNARNKNKRIDDKLFKQQGVFFLVGANHY